MAQFNVGTQFGGGPLNPKGKLMKPQDFPPWAMASPAEMAGRTSSRMADNPAIVAGNKQREWEAMLRSFRSGTNPLFVDPSAAIEAQKPGIVRQREASFNAAANRASQAGALGLSDGKMASGSEYQGLLGESSQAAADEFAKIAAQYGFEAQTQNRDTMKWLMDKYGAGVTTGGGGGGGGAGYGRSAGGYTTTAGYGGGKDPLRATYEQDALRDAIGRMRDPLYDQKRELQRQREAEMLAEQRRQFEIGKYLQKRGPAGGGAPPPGAYRG